MKNHLVAATMMISLAANSFGADWRAQRVWRKRNVSRNKPRQEIEGMKQIKNEPSPNTAVEVLYAHDVTASTGAVPLLT